MKPSAKRALSILLFLSVLAFVVSYGLQTVRRYGSHIWSFGPDAMLPALLAVTAGYLNRFLMWRRSALRFGLRAGPAESSGIYFVSTLGKYVPGKVGLLVLRARLAGRGQKGVSLAPTAVEYGASFAAAGTLALAGAALASNPDVITMAGLSAGVLAMLGLIHPAALRTAVGVYERVSGRDVDLDIPPYRVMLSVYLGMLLTGLCNGLALYILLSSVSDSLTLADLVPVAGAYYLAAIGGLAAVFAPGGIGVREGLLFVLLPAVVSQGAAVSGASMMRVITLAAELLLAGAGWMAWRLASSRRDCSD